MIYIASIKDGKRHNIFAAFKKKEEAFNIFKEMEGTFFEECETVNGHWVVYTNTCKKLGTIDCIKIIEG